jgi:hypothetical protein
MQIIIQVWPVFDCWWRMTELLFNFGEKFFLAAPFT